MNTYIAFYKGKRLEIVAHTTYEAQQLATKSFMAKKSHEVTVMLIEKDGKPITHTAVD